MEKLIDDKHSTSSKKLLVLVCAVLLALLLIACSVFSVLYVQQLHHQQMQWVGFKGSYQGRTGSMNEESEIDEARRLIVHVNAEGWKLGINNSISLHDYNNGLLATRVMESGKCMIINLIDTYEEAVLALQRFNKTGVSVSRPTRYFDGGVIIPQQELEAEIGTTLAGFCRGFPTIRLHEVPAGSLSNRERRLAPRRESTIPESFIPVRDPFQAVCIQNCFHCIEDIALA